MPRRPLIITKNFPYHVTARSNNKEWFYLPLPEVWNIFCEHLSETGVKYNVSLHAFVLMSNHFHLILTTPEPLGEVMRHLLTGVSKAIQKHSGRINHIFGARYRWSILDTPSSIAYVYKYVARNPVRANICSQVGEYPYSSFALTTGIKYPPIVQSIEPLWRLIERQPNLLTQWLNRPVGKELEPYIGRALRRDSFTFSQGNDARKSLQALERDYGILSESEVSDRYLFGRKGD